MEHLISSRQLISLLKGALAKDDYYNFMLLCTEHAIQISNLDKNALNELSVLFYDYILSHPDALEFYSKRYLIDFSIEELKTALPLKVFFSFVTNLVE